MKMPKPKLGYNAYKLQRRQAILDSVKELSPEALAEWSKAASRLNKRFGQFSEKATGRVFPFGTESALELLVTIYACDDSMPVRDLPE
jgi:hypothetical protein